jgi:glucose-6-phosphate 1-dehydrogenase
MSTEVRPTILVIIGITGDLGKRKLLPAIDQIVKSSAAPSKLKVIGITRRAISVKEVLDGVPLTSDFLHENLEMYTMDLSNPSDYEKLSGHLSSIRKEFGEGTQMLFYLSVPPQISEPIVGLLGRSSIINLGETKLLLEKPFGTDLGSAKDLVEKAKEHFKEEQIYRIDHYLAKEMVQNLVVFRQSNSLFKRTWNNNFIESIEIVASETIGIEGRAAFYEQTGALRDLVQSHLLQLAALTLAELPPDDWQLIPEARLKALRQIIPPSDIHTAAVRGQYKGYETEAENPGTKVETFVSLTLFSSDPRWEGVPIKLTTGKALDKKVTEIRLRYKQEHVDEANSLILRIQPNEGVEVDLLAKKPGYDREIQRFPLSFNYSHHFSGLPEAYERVFVDAIRSDRSLFTTSEEVLETWRILEPVQKAWDMNTSNLVLYERGVSPDDIA